MALADREFERILLIKLSAIGDVIHAIPVLDALRRRYPRAKIDWISKPTPASFIRGLPGVDDVIVYGENQTEAPQYKWDGVTHFFRQLRDHRFLTMLSKLRQARYDLVIDLQGQFKSGFLSMVTRAPVRVGFDRPRKSVWAPAARSLPAGTMKRAWKGAREGSWLAYTHPIRLESLSIHPVDRYLLVGKLLGFEDRAAEFSLPVDPRVEMNVDELLKTNAGGLSGAPIVLMPSSLWATKRWTQEGYAAVARHFLARGHRVLIAGGANESAECARVAESAPGALSVAGRTSLSELAALISRSAIILCNDSGPLHLASALGKSAVAVFGPTHPLWAGPYHRPDLVVREAIDCSPCYIKSLARCPRNHACMTQVTPARVIDKMEFELSKP